MICRDKKDNNRKFASILIKVVVPLAENVLAPLATIVAAFAAEVW